MGLVLNETESTQTFLKERIHREKGAISHLEYVLAHRQTAGQGRQGRSWISEPGNLFISVWIKDFKLPVTWIPHFVSLSLLRVFDSYLVPSERLQIKWPNDVLVDGEKKISGILCEKIEEGVLAGVGVNLISSPDLSERKTESLLSLVPGLKKEGLNLEFKDRLIAALRKEPSLEDLKKAYLENSLLKPGDALHWEDLQTHQKGSGNFLRYGNFGELIAQTEAGEKTLFSEEVHLLKK